MRFSTRTIPALAAAAAGLALALVLAGCGDQPASSSSNDDKLTFAAVPSEQDVDPTVKYQSLAKLMEKVSGRKVEVVRSTDYNAVIEGMVSGKIDVAEFGPLSYVLAKSNGADITPVGATVEKGQTSGTYQSFAFVPSDSPIKDLKGFKGKKVCFVDPSSTSGYLFPSAGLLKEGIDPKTGVEPVMAGGHDNSVSSVAAGKCEAGFAYDTMVEKTSVDKGVVKPGQLRVVWKSDPIPNSPVAISNKLPADVKENLTRALSTTNVDSLVEQGICAKADDCSITSDPAVWGFSPVTDKTFDPVRDVCAATKNAECSKG